MSATVIIPARRASRRLHAKPLRIIDREPLIIHTWRAAQRVGVQVYVATDCPEIREVARVAGADVVMTGAAKNGTERCALAVKELGLKGTIINWQGDSPLCRARWARKLARALDAKPDCAVATPFHVCCPQTEKLLLREQAKGVVGATTVAVDGRNRALYFSKSAIPRQGPWKLHIGMYAYRAERLLKYGTEPTPLEKAEGLEQLRWLERGHRIQCVPVDADGPVWEVNVEGDLAVVGDILRKCGAD